MLINGDPKFSDIPPLQRHFLYGVNCYQFAIGFDPVTIFTDAANPKRFAYQSLCPGHVAEHLSLQGSTHVVAPTLKKLIIEGCKDDGLIELEQRSLNAAINVPDGHRLIAMYFTDESEHFYGDFHFAAFNPAIQAWQEKTPFSDTDTLERLQPFINGGYIFQRFFIAPDHMTPNGVPTGQIVTPHDGPALNFVKDKPYWARGPVLEDRGNGSLFLRRQCPLYAKPSWPELKTA